MKMPGMDGMSLLQALKKESPDLPVIMMTAFGSVDKAVEAMKIGAFDYLTKPFENEAMLVTVAKAAGVSRLINQNRMLKVQVADQLGFGKIIGRSEAMRQVFDLVSKVAPAKTTVLISGESGSGKELVARAIHDKSTRESKPFISVNCSALAENLLESELFGHEKGAFTGAVSARKGRFEVADQGSLFLDEIAHTSRPLQVKLLRVVQEMAFERVGGSRTMEVDVRLITASNRNLKGRGRGRPLPGRPLLSAQRGPHQCPSAPGEGRGHRPIGGVFPGKLRRRTGPDRAGVPLHRPGGPGQLPLAG